MGQEAGKSAWPRPAGGYQTISGRRYGRRHAYISFRPLTDKQRATSGVDCQNMERTSSQKDQAVASKASISSVLQTILPTPCTNSVRSELNAASSHEGHSKRQSSLLRVLKAPSNHFKRPKTERVVPYDKQYCPGIERSDRARVWPINEDRKPNPEALSYINIDAYEPDSSGAEEEDLSLNPSLPAQKRLDGICALGGNIDSLDDSHPDIFPKTSKRSAQTVPSKNLTELPFEEPDFQRTVQANGNVGQSLVGEDQASNGHGFMAGAGGVSYMSTEETLQSEMVVRPKIRKQTSETHLERRKRSEKEDVSHLSGSADRNKCGSAPPGFLAQTSPENEFLFEFPPMTLSDLYSKDTKSVNDDNTKVDDDDDDDDNIWEDLEKFEPSTKGDESSSSEFSEGEWSASWTSDSGLEKERCTSEESWETLPGMDEPPGSSNSLEEVPSLNLALEEQTPLEEGEIPWLMYNEDSGSSSDEDPDGVSQFVHPGLFILDGNNNLEDDSSMSEDLDTEWRFLDEFGDGFGMAQAISYVDHSQLLTYMALEERLAQAMEAALAHLESLAIDVEQAHPPATEQIIDCLPQITVPAENIEQEQCCAICCCEYVKDEIATLLPCRHMFHKLCVTLWLRKSGTCPVCRHVLTPEVTDPSSLSSEQETPPSSHSASEGTC
ncbi:E3 ubiquitin-protein ligase Praja-2 isoform X1 [Pimephales promelas]|uniref:E3 ubiquitin-protein ligase Praja-2 isoform X1 n=1 Tax=Pimephales promelas TaxID=90988 RepID=UPI00195558A3|nr:E3 ubiquitin-protein ligase Praja-2 isoform X1 [Pimephales promelas]